MWSFIEFEMSRSLDELLLLSSNETYFAVFLTVVVVVVDVVGAASAAATGNGGGTVEFVSGSGDVDGAGEDPDSLSFSMALCDGTLFTSSAIWSPLVVSPTSAGPLDSLVWPVPLLSVCIALSFANVSDNVSSCSSSK